MAGIQRQDTSGKEGRRVRPSQDGTDKEDQKGEPMKGNVKSFSPRNGYGFITAGGIDYFIHAKDWQYRLPPTAGLRVEFVPERTDKGMKATQIRRVQNGK